LEDAVASQRADLGRIGRGLNAEGRTERGRLMQQEAGGRALTRTGSRAGVAVLAAQAGNELRKAKEEADEEKRTSKANAPKRTAAEVADTSGADPDAVRGMQYGRGAPDGMKRGGKVSSASNRADGCAQRGKTRGKFI
jgi:hypothetical protein